MKKSVFLFGLSYLFSQTATAQDLATACAAITQKSFLKTEIKSAEWVEKTAELAAHCLVKGEIEKRVGVNNQPYSIQFELRLPQDWNEKFLFQGAGGIGGVIFPAVGQIYPHGAKAVNGLNRGYAVVSNDSGHPTRDLVFTEDQQAKLNYAYASIGKVNDVAKQIISQFYGKASQHNYFMGCSNGGREAMIAAMRYPLEFDGVIAGSPAFRISRSVLAEVWDNRILLDIAPINQNGKKILSKAFRQTELDAISKAVLERCDKLDGLQDGLINAWEQCDFQPEMVEKDIGREKMNALKRLFEGVKDSKGNALYSAWPYDSGLNSVGWRQWKLGDSETEQPNSISFNMGLKSLTHYYLTPRQPLIEPLSLVLDQIAEQVKEIGGIHNADDMDLSTFQQQGGKMLIYQGISDPIFSALDLRDWYQQLMLNNANITDTVNVFFVPAMNHCGRGATVNDFDMLTVLENWVEKGKSPQRIIAKAGELYPNQEKQIPLCPYPQMALYQGGDPNKAESFICGENK